jgi:phage gp29-like protein
MAWGVNTVFGMTPGYDAKLLESNGRGHESFESSMDRSDRETIIAIAGQIVTTEGGTGFVNGDLYKSIRADVIQEVAEALAYTVNTQILPPWIVTRYGLDALADGGAVYQYDIDPPKELAQTAAAMTATGAAIKVLDESLQAHDLQADAKEILDRAGIPVAKGKAALPAAAAPGDTSGASAEKLASSTQPSAVAKQTQAPKVEDDDDDEEEAA